jgi:hypothetical protein
MSMEFEMAVVPEGKREDGDYYDIVDVETGSMLPGVQVSELQGEDEVSKLSNGYFGLNESAINYANKLTGGLLREFCGDDNLRYIMLSRRQDQLNRLKEALLEFPEVSNGDVFVKRVLETVVNNSFDYLNKHGEAAALVIL